MDSFAIKVFLSSFVSLATLSMQLVVKVQLRKDIFQKKVGFWVGLTYFKLTYVLQLIFSMLHLHRKRVRGLHHFPPISIFHVMDPLFISSYKWDPLIRCLTYIYFFRF